MGKEWQKRDDKHSKFHHFLGEKLEGKEEKKRERKQFTLSHFISAQIEAHEPVAIGFIILKN